MFKYPPTCFIHGGELKDGQTFENTQRISPEKVKAQTFVSNYCSKKKGRPFWRASIFFSPSPVYVLGTEIKFSMQGNLLSHCNASFADPLQVFNLHKYYNRQISMAAQVMKPCVHQQIGKVLT